MHDWYMTFLVCLGVELDMLEWYERYGRGAALKHKTATLIRFDREIILAQKAFDMAECVRNSPITGDSNDMSAKTVPTAIQLNGYVYFLDLNARNSMAPEVVVKPADAPVVGSLKYKVELDTSDVDALLAKLSSGIQSTDLGEGLTAAIQGEQAIFEPRSFTLVNNGSINITAADVDKSALSQSVQQIVEDQLRAAYQPGGLIWKTING